MQKLSQREIDEVLSTHGIEDHWRRNEARVQQERQYKLRDLQRSFDRQTD